VTRMDAIFADSAAAGLTRDKGNPGVHDPRVIPGSSPGHSPGTGTEEPMEKDRPFDPMSGKNTSA
jgi:hypothetical protein